MITKLLPARRKRYMGAVSWSWLRELARRRVFALCGTLLVSLVFAVGLISSCQLLSEARDLQPAPIRESGQITGISPNGVVSAMIGQVDQARALTALRRLTGDEPLCAGQDCYTIENRVTGSKGLLRATDYIFDELGGLGYRVSIQNWTRSGRSDRNVIARKPGVYAPGEEIYLVAHVDGVKPGTAQRFPAADDDASGVVDNLEVARILSRYSFSRTLVLLFTTGEEQGTLGARSHLEQLSERELGAIKYAVDVDMIGYDGNGDRGMQLWHGGDAPSMAVTQMMSETIRTYGLRLAPQFVVGCG